MGLFVSLQMVLNRRQILGSRNHCHTDAHVEDAEHLRLLDLSELLKQGKYRKNRPASDAKVGRAMRREDTRNVLGKSAASDMGHPPNQILINQRFQDLRVVEMRCQEGRSNGLVQPSQSGLNRIAAGLQ